MRELYFLFGITVFLTIVSLASRAAGYLFQRFHLWTSMNDKSYLSQSRRYEDVKRFLCAVCIVSAIASPLLGGPTFADHIALLMSCMACFLLVVLSTQSHLNGAIYALVERQTDVDLNDLEWINKQTRRWRWIHRLHDLYARRPHRDILDLLQHDMTANQTPL